MEFINVKKKIYNSEMSYKEYEMFKETKYTFIFARRTKDIVESIFEDSRNKLKANMEEILFKTKTNQYGEVRALGVYIKDNKIHIISLDCKIFESYEFHNPDLITEFFEGMEWKIKKTYRIKQALLELGFIEDEQVRITRLNQDNYVIHEYGNISIKRNQTLEGYHRLQEEISKKERTISKTEYGICHQSQNKDKTVFHYFIEDRIIRITLKGYKQLFNIRELITKHEL